MNSILKPLNLLYIHRRMLLCTTWNDVRGRFAGSVLGLAWLALYPLLLLGTYALVYVYVFKVRFALFDSHEYVALIFCGLIPFLGFAEALGAGVSSVTGNRHLIRNTLFPIELIPVKAVLVSQSTQLVGMALLVVALAILQKLTAAALVAILIWTCQVAFMIGMIWIVSSVNVLVRDLQSVVSVLLLVLMLASPIAYTEDMIPENLRLFLQVNPLYYFIIAYQKCLQLGEMPSSGLLLGVMLMSAGVFFFGYWFFIRMKLLFVDNV